MGLVIEAKQYRSITSFCNDIGFNRPSMCEILKADNRKLYKSSQILHGSRIIVIENGTILKTTNF